MDAILLMWGSLCAVALFWIGGALWQIAGALEQCERDRDADALARDAQKEKP